MTNSHSPCSADSESDRWLCPRCKRRERENIDGDWMFYCGPCNDRDYERYRERQEWDHYHRDEK